MAPRIVSRWVPAGATTPARGALARMVKKAANRPLKNMSSEPSQMITPIASIGGRSWTILPWGAGCSTGTGLGQQGNFSSRPAPLSANKQVNGPPFWTRS